MSKRNLRNTSSLTVTLSTKSQISSLASIHNWQEEVTAVLFNDLYLSIIEELTPIPNKHESTHPSFALSGEIVVKDFKDLKLEDLSQNEVALVNGSKIILSKKESGNQFKTSSIKGHSLLQILKPHSLMTVSRKTSAATSAKSSRTSLQRSNKCSSSSLDHQSARIVFTSGGVYEGHVVNNNVMHGKGRYEWPDGTIYEGDFKDHYPTGYGRMLLPDLSYYEGSFDHGLFHGDGYLNVVSTPMFYSGQWKHGKKHGKGWMLYEPNNWYEGQWKDDARNGHGLRHYKNGVRYEGNWDDGIINGIGMMIWENNDLYKGNFCNGIMSGHGEYIWKAFCNTTFTFPIQNTYRGNWCHGKRSGSGTMLFGSDSGARLHGQWEQDFKHGTCTMICGNGKILTDALIFHHDKPVSPYDLHQMVDVPIFTVDEAVDAGFYIQRILDKLSGVAEPGALLKLKMYEENSLKNVLIVHMPKLKALYHQYATIATEKELGFEPAMTRLFLWQLYKDVRIERVGVSLVDTDRILGENPSSCVESLCNPFEAIYFWQFLLSLIGVALSTHPFDEVLDVQPKSGVCAFIVEKFLDEVVLKALGRKESRVFKYLDLVSIKSIYGLYQSVGESLTARDFLKLTCLKRKQQPPCYLKKPPWDKRFHVGMNMVPISDEIIFFNKELCVSRAERGHEFSSLSDFRVLGPKNVVNCLTIACPMIKSENVVVNLNYPLTFIEFFEALLECIFKLLDLQIKRKKRLMENIIARNESVFFKRLKPSKSNVSRFSKARKSKSRTLQ